ncbi:MAG: phenylacetic acid degradation protein, partial [Rhodobacteraceae bacterium]|nr:phenylacetic acid degradation protein [Paracoccaceae bacterium]
MDPLAPLIDALHAEGRLRVWSLVITVFGDSVQHRGGRISTARL